MAITQIQLPELQVVLQDIVQQATRENYPAGCIFAMLYATGLRVNEVLETDRWQRTGPAEYTVQLSKREGTRTIPESSVPAGIRAYFDNHQSFDMQTYSSINNLFKRLGPGLYFETQKKTTTSHAFRYAYIKQLRANGLSISDIAVQMGHLGTASTSAYAGANIFRGPLK